MKHKPADVIKEYVKALGELKEQQRKLELVRAFYKKREARKGKI